MARGGMEAQSRTVSSLENDLHLAQDSGQLLSLRWSVSLGYWIMTSWGYNLGSTIRTFELQDVFASLLGQVGDGPCPGPPK